MNSRMPHAVAFNGGEYRTFRGLCDKLEQTYPDATAWNVNLDDGYVIALVEYRDGSSKHFRSSHLIVNGVCRLIRTE